MKKKKYYIVILLGLLGAAVTYFIDDSRNKQWRAQIREENTKTAEILRTEIKNLFCKKYLMMELISSELISSPEKENQVLEKYAEKMKPWELMLIKDFSSSEISSFLIAVRDNPSGKGLAVKKIDNEVNSLCIAYPARESGQILLAESSPEDILLTSCSGFLPKYKLTLYATDLFGEKGEVFLVGNKDTSKGFEITFPVLKHKHNLILKLALKKGKCPAQPNRIGIWSSGLGITLLLVSFLTILRKKNIVLSADNALYRAKEKGRNCVCYSDLREEVMDKNEHLVSDLKKIEKGGVKEMKIAVATTDKVNVSEHFGTAPYFFVAEVEGEKIANEEVRDKPCHKQLSTEEEHAQVDERGTHGFTAKASERHKEMGEAVKDCEVVIAGRIGAGAYEDLKELGLKVIATDVKDVKEAVSLCAKGELLHKEERIH